jgi:hypothetical protein
MTLFSYLWDLRKSARSVRRQPARARLAVECLEDRLTPSTMATSQNNLLVNSPAAQSFYVNNGQLVVNGDQLGYGYSDTIIIDVNASRGVYVNLNGTIASFGYGQITSIVVNTGAGSNAVYVNNEAYGVPLSINDGGYDYIHVGSNGSVQGIWGSVSIYNPYYYTNLVIDDSADVFGRTVYVNSTYVVGLAPAGIYFHYNDLSYLTIYGGSGGNNFNILGTPSTYTGSYAGYTWIASGTGSDTVNVFATTGGAYPGGLYVNGQSGQDSVYIGSNSSSVGQGGSLASINGFVDVFNYSGSTWLFVDDSGDTISRTATLNGYSLTGLSAGTIYWSPTTTYYGGVTYLEIFGSAAASTYNVTDTPNLYYYTYLSTGNGSDTVNITGTTGFLYTYNRGGYDSVIVGDGTLTNIRGGVYAYGAGSTYLYIQDYNDATAHSATLSSNSLTGLSTGTIWWSSSATAMGGVTYLRIAGSAAGSTYTVADTPSTLYGNDLVTGAGSDTVFVTATTGALNLFSYGGMDFVYIGNSGSLAGINGNVYVSGAGSTYLYIQDDNDTVARNAVLTASSLTGLSRGAIRWVASSAATGGVTFLSIDGSGAGSTYTIADTPNLYYYVNFYTGPGSDTVLVTGTTAALYLYNGGGADNVVIGRQASATSGGSLAAIRGLLDIYGAGTTTLTIDGSADANGRNITLTSYTVTGLAPAAIYYGTNVAALAITAGIGNDTLTVSDSSSWTPVAFDAGGGTNTVVGPNCSTRWDITGANAGYVAGVNFVNVANLVGGNAADMFGFETGASVASIDGGGAPAGQGDWLDYTAYAALVTVNLATGHATGVTGTIANIQNVLGSEVGNTLIGNAQGNILVGGDGADTIIGGDGRSILIGGKGSDVIIGGAADDVIIGGYTIYRTAYNAWSLMDLLARWQSADSYESRVAVLRSTWRPLNPGTTVFDDGGSDQLTGGGGRDWFIVGLNGTLNDRQDGEAIN